LTPPSSSAAIIRDPLAYLKALREGTAPAVPDLDSSAVAALADAAAEEEMLGDMATFSPAVTGVHNTIFVSTKAGVRHGPRIKVAIDPPTHFRADGETASVTFDGDVVAGDVTAAVLKDIRRFIELNREALIAYWEQTIPTDELQ